MGFFDRFYYGKAGKADYTVDDLPANRLQLFFQVLKVRFFSLIRVNLMQLVFWLPFAFWTFINLLMLNNMSADAIEAGVEANQALVDSFMQVIMMYLLGLIPCLLITGPSSAGAAYITRNWSRDQHSFIWSDFKDAIKENWKQALGVSAITSVLPALLFFVYTFYGNLRAEYPVLLVVQMLVVMLGVVAMLAISIIYPLMVTYQLKFMQLWRNAFLLAVGRLPQLLGLRLLTLLPLVIAVVITFIGSLGGVLFLVLYYLLLGFALFRLIFASYANAVFDKFINPRIEGAPVNLGLRPDEDEDDEGEDEGSEKDGSDKGDQNAQAEG